MAEAILLKKFKHKNVLGLRGVVMTTLPWLIIIEFIPYGDLRAVLKNARKFKVPVPQPPISVLTSNLCWHADNAQFRLAL